MSTELLLKALFSTLFSLMLGWEVFSRFDSEIGSEAEPQTAGQRYRPYLPASLLPLFLLILVGFELSQKELRQAVPMLFSLMVTVVLSLSVYYLILLFLLPLLRRKISLRACAMLWIIPNFLYLTQSPFLRVPAPVWVLPLSEELLWSLFALWAAGFFLVFCWKVVSHLLFRRRILAGATPVTEPEVTALLQEEADLAGFRKFGSPLVRSEKVSSPLTVGLFRRSVRIVLPMREFSPEEYRLIFRHELIHISREDAVSKFFLTFCTALCWWNPFLWVAGKRCADDLELSCDESVLQNRDAAARNRYAQLILKAAGDDRGFTTCLSAAASTVRYRLQCVTDTRKRRSGAITVALVFFLLCMSCGYTAVAYGEQPGSEALLLEEDGGQLPQIVRVTGGEYDTALDHIDAAALEDYLSGLTLMPLTGNFSFSGEPQLELEYRSGPEGFRLVQLRERTVSVLPLSGEKRVYYLKEPADQELLNALAPELPEGKLRLKRKGDSVGMGVTPAVTRLLRISGGEETLLIDRKEKGDRGVYSDSPAGEWAELEFSLPVCSPVQVTVFPQTGGSYSAQLTETEEGWRFPLDETFADYTISAAFTGRDGSEYRAEFFFRIGNAAEVPEE